ncbi:MAG: stage II sporulation protein P [Lachnospiraceae bacterium]|nr:stage II sporulation protein P [Lachnospiraceae bacterium]
MNIGYQFKKRWLFIAIFLLASIQLFTRAISDIENSESLGENMYDTVLKHGIGLYNPYVLYINGGWKSKDMAELLWQQFYKDMPLELCILESADDDSYMTEYMQQQTAQEILPPAEDTVSQADIAVEEEDSTQLEMQTDSRMQELEQAVLAENTAATGVFVPVQAPVAVYSEQQLRQSGFIKETFYSEDATTQIKEEQLQYDTLMGYDATLKQDNSNIQILVYHTHSQESYIDSIKGDSSTSIVGVGEHLCEILRTQYGFNVLHHTGEYDVESRDYAYSNAMKGLDKVLAENPTIEVMIDLHRDETNADTKLVTTIQNKAMARFMFFNGLCYTRELGALENLPNPYVQDNLSFAFQMQLAAEEYYPGLTRRIYLKGYRYNLHYRPKSLLIELGSQTNTVEEAMNSCDPIAHIIAMVLNGENKE